MAAGLTSLFGLLTLGKWVLLWHCTRRYLKPLWTLSPTTTECQWLAPQSLWQIREQNMCHWLAPPKFLKVAMFWCGRETKTNQMCTISEMAHFNGAIRRRQA